MAFGDLRFSDFNLSEHRSMTGGTGADSWCSASSSGSINASFNVASYTRASTGVYDVVFTNPMPSADYAIVIGHGTSPTRVIQYSSQTVNGFRLTAQTSGSGTASDTAISFTVHATNAQLPETITMAMWNDLVARVTALENP